MPQENKAGEKQIYDLLSNTVDWSLSLAVASEKIYFGFVKPLQSRITELEAENKKVLGLLESQFRGNYAWYAQLEFASFNGSSEDKITKMKEYVESAWQTFLTNNNLTLQTKP